MKEKLKQINDFEWILPKDSKDGMNVDAKIIASKKMMNVIEDEAINQLTNVTMLPGVENPVIGLPDMHWGYGFPVGAVSAFDENEGIISSGLCGFDINCGINLVRTNLTYKEVKDKLNELVQAIYNKVPVGVGTKGKIRLTKDQLDELIVKGAKWAVDNGYGTKDDLKHTEENGAMPNADPTKVSDLAKKRGMPQLGTLGAGNHFLEIQKVTHILDSQAEKWGIKDKNQVLFMIHCGSRGFGHQIATDYLKIQEKAVKKYNIKIPDQQLACAPVSSQEGQDFFAAMKAAVNYSFTNRLIITHWVREAFEEVFKKSSEDMDISTIYGICHNVIKYEKIKNKNYYVHRKGATRSFPDLPVLIAGSMGTSSYLLKGTKEALEKTFGSSAHGAGRSMSRSKALKEFRGQDIIKELSEKGIVSKSPSPKGMAEEAPLAYKDVEEVINSIKGAGISIPVTRLAPIGVLKG